MSEVLTRVQDTAIRGLSSLVVRTLSNPDYISPIPALTQNQDDILGRFMDNMAALFNELAGTKQRERESVNFETLSLVQEDELEVMVAVEGMVAAARNQHLPHFISFNTRLNALLEDRRVDESSNPLDPQQIANAFVDAVKPVGLDGTSAIVVYRGFSGGVLRELESVLHAANQVLIDHGVIPNLGLEGGKPSAHTSARSGARDASERTGFGAIEPKAAEQQQPPAEMFSLMQNLLHREAQTQSPSGLPTQPADAGPELDTDALEREFMVPASLIKDGEDALVTSRAGSIGNVMRPMPVAADQQVETVDQSQLMSILTNIQKTLEATSALVPAEGEQRQPNIAASLGEALTDEDQPNVIKAIDRHSSDVINLVTMLYEAIWQDDSVPIPIKELIGRTQITIIKVALSDTTFFNVEDHPARAILNEFAAAGIGWAEVEKLEEDPLYQKMATLVQQIAEDFAGQVDFFENLIKDFRTFRAREAARSRKLEQRILKAKERQERLDDIHQLVTQKIDERVLGRDLHPFISDLLAGPFHKFMVMLVVKEGPGGNAWKQAINTIDVLLWSVQPNKQTGDEQRLETVNPRLLNNLRKAFRIAQMDRGEVDTLVTQLREVQSGTFEDAAADAEAAIAAAVAYEESADDADESHAMIEPPPEAPQEVPPEYLAQIDAFTVGIWVEFQGEEDQHLRCKLAAKINAIDKYIFVNRQGVKVVEKTKDGLARELADGTVKVISDGLLFSRALESVIGNLRESQTAQQTGSAYQPPPAA